MQQAAGRGGEQGREAWCQWLSRKPGHQLGRTCLQVGKEGLPCSNGNVL